MNHYACVIFLCFEILGLPLLLAVCRIAKQNTPNQFKRK